MALTDNLFAFYKLDDLQDSSGNNRTLTNNGNVTFSSGKIGNAAVCNNGYLRNNTLQMTGRNGTVAMWVKKPISSDYSLFETGTINGSAEHSLRFYILNGSIGADCCYNSISTRLMGSISDNTWTHLALTTNGTDFKLFINGTLIQNTDVSGITGGFEGGDNGVSINSNSLGNFGTSECSYDAVGIWNRALSDAEVAELYSAGAGIEYPFGGGSPATSFVKIEGNTKFFGTTKFVV